MQISNELKTRLRAKYSHLDPSKMTATDIASTINWQALWVYLQESEQQLTDLMADDPPAESAAGNIEYSWVLYFLNNDLEYYLDEAGLKWVYYVLQAFLDIEQMPASTITPNQWSEYEQTWQGQGVLSGDGTLVSSATYAQLDPGWATAVVDYLLSVNGWLNGAVTPFPTNPASVTIPVSSYPSLKVALFGDWGTGAYVDGNLTASPSQLIGALITAQQPDVSIHLGDVYYAGSPNVVLAGNTTPGEEQTNFVNCWPTPASKYNFTLNSNHEMYSGANGLFSNALNNPIFKGQQGTSYFQVQYGNWLIIGLDSAFYDSPGTFFMDGALTDPNQIAFLNAAGINAKQNNLQVVILTHHTAINTSGTAKTALYNQVVRALLMPQPEGQAKGVEPAYWYYGHVHNGIVYTPQSAAGSINCRCLGNAAIPIGNASWLQDAMAANPQTVSYYTNTALTNTTTQQTLRVLNGYAILTFTPTTIVETWYNQDGTEAWTSV